MKNREKYAEEIKSITINGNNDINLCNKIIKPIILKQNNSITNGKAKKMIPLHTYSYHTHISCA